MVVGGTAAGEAAVGPGVEVAGPRGPVGLGGRARTTGPGPSRPGHPQEGGRERGEEEGVKQESEEEGLRCVEAPVPVAGTVQGCPLSHPHTTYFQKEIIPDSKGSTEADFSIWASLMSSFGGDSWLTRSKLLRGQWGAGAGGQGGWEPSWGEARAGHGRGPHLCLRRPKALGSGVPLAALQPLGLLPRVPRAHPALRSRFPHCASRPSAPTPSITGCHPAQARGLAPGRAPGPRSWGDGPTRASPTAPLSSGLHTWAAGQSAWPLLGVRSRIARPSPGSPPPNPVHARPSPPAPHGPVAASPVFFGDTSWNGDCHG